MISHLEIFPHQISRRGSNAYSNIYQNLKTCIEIHFFRKVYIDQIFFWQLPTVTLSRNLFCTRFFLLRCRSQEARFIYTSRLNMNAIFLQLTCLKTSHTIESICWHVHTRIGIEIICQSSKITESQNFQNSSTIWTCSNL